MDKYYVVVVDAERQRLNNGNLVQYGYRIGDMGLVHPKILDFYKNFEQTEYAPVILKEGNESTFVRGISVFQTSGLMIELYKHDPKDIQVLMCRGNLANGGRSPGKDGNPPELVPRRYFMTALRDGEFITINGYDLPEVKDQVKRTYANKNIKTCCSAEEFIAEIERQWKYLNVFDNWIEQHKDVSSARARIHDVPMEVAQINIPREFLRSELELAIDLATGRGPKGRWRSETPPSPRMPLNLVA